MKKTTFQNQEFIDVINNNFVPIQIDAQESKDTLWGEETIRNTNFDASRESANSKSCHEILNKMEDESIPNVLVLDYDLNNFASILGNRDAQVLRSFVSVNTGRF
jgi:thioredoxin-related protein